MSILHLDRRADGSLSLFIDGDLQFDSRDERIYHECLVLPALALASHHQSHGLRALICGGGDGLALREVLKSAAITQVDLVDYDPQVVVLARQAWPELLDGAFDDPRVQIHHTDALAFVSEALTAGRHYDLIIVDLTVPQDSTSAAFHSIEWYGDLAVLLTPQGALAVNGLSPSATPEAFWTPYNALRTAGLIPKPYRIALPSFSEQGYGPDWGFFLATLGPWPASHLETLTLPGPRQALRDAGQLRRLFHVPAAIAELRGTVSPVHKGDDTLLRRLGQTRHDVPPAPLWDALAEAADPAPLPASARSGILPEPVREAITAHTEAARTEAVNGDALLKRVLQVMPALQPQHTRDMIETLLQDPGRFLAPIDLSSLVDRLLARAAELPARIVEELRHLKAKLQDVLGDPAKLLQLGLRVVTVVVVVLVVANLILPDSAYGKGGGLHTGNTAASLYHSEHVTGTAAGEPTLARGSGFRQSLAGRHRTVDEDGILYPARRYRFRRPYVWYGLHHHPSHPAVPAHSDQAAEAESLFRLSPETDLLDDGRVAFTVTDNTYLTVSPDTLQVVDGRSGDEVMTLQRSANVAYRLGQELGRQEAGLAKTLTAKANWNAWVDWIAFTPWHGGDQAELQNLQGLHGKLVTARHSLGLTGLVAADPTPPPVPGAYELMASVWLMPDGSGVIARLPDGTDALLTPDAWNALPGTFGQVPGDYPAGFREAVADVLGHLVKDAEGLRTSLVNAQSDLERDLASLMRDEREYTQIRQRRGPDEIVDYGTDEIPVSQALALTNQDLAATRSRIADVEKRLLERPQVIANAQSLLAAFKRTGGGA